MKPILIKNGYVYDPINKVNGEKMNIAIKDGKIVEESQVNPLEAEVIDATNKVVMPGGIDIHTHVAGYAINSGRLYRPEDGHSMLEPRTHITRSGAGYSVPSTFVTGYRYARMGYTMLCEPAMPPLLARHTHEELNDIPIVDTAAFTLMTDNWIIIQYLKKGEYEKCAAFVAWLLRATKGYCIKMVNPGGVEAWGWKGSVKSLNDVVPYFEITPAQLIRGLGMVNEMLKLPHSIHLHTNQLGLPGNFEITLGTFDLAKDLKVSPAVGERKQNMHVTHIQFSSFGGDSWANLESKADEIAKYVNTHPNVTIDIGQVIPGETTTMTADGPLEYGIHRLNSLKWMNKDVEIETGGGLVPFIYSRKSAVNSVQWAIGLELALLIKNPFQVYLTTDHPNAGPFIHYPKIISWLMSQKARELEIQKLHPAVGKRSLITTINREYDLYEIAVITRAGQALALGLSKSKGHLGPGADADVAIYDLDPNNLTPEGIEKAFSRALYTIKGGEVVVKNGEVAKVSRGKRFWVNPKVSDSLERTMLKEIRRIFVQYYTVNMNNFPVQESYVPLSSELRIDAVSLR
ncbi:MAG: formylmethanofuran dehydrogenase subunit A [Nitrososphaerota archaeon]|nr:formylmethanofuran dehydrogenase subunit A [Candidatus Bathyarchaeota archaeon]MDW8022736.1 formylmethanofuran dehydrogenase subunit A [Nitrososphaerota archaeon]